MYLLRCGNRIKLFSADQPCPAPSCSSEILESRRFRNTSRYSECHGEQAAPRLCQNTGDTPYGVGVGVAVGVAVGVGVGLTTTTIVEVPVPSLGNFLKVMKRVAPRTGATVT